MPAIAVQQMTRKSGRPSPWYHARQGFGFAVLRSSTYDTAVSEVGGRHVGCESTESKKNIPVFGDEDPERALRDLA